MIGFSFLLLVFASGMFYGWVKPQQLVLTILSIVFLMVCMFIREYEEYSLETVFKEKEQIINVASSQLQQKHQPREEKE
jgi:hypothetical protein